MEKLELLGDGLDGGRVMAWMLFPKEPEVRMVHFVKEVMAQNFIKERASSELVNVPVWALQSLLEGPSKSEIHNLATEATKQGTVAGDLLGLMYEMHLRGVNEPSFGKAVEQYKEFAFGLRYGDSEALKRSEATLRNYFDAFEPVAHLWAAFRLNQGPYTFTTDPRDVFHTSDGLKSMLGVAKTIGEFATTFIPKRTKPPKPVIGSGTLVKIPDEIPALHLIFKAVEQ